MYQPNETLPFLDFGNRRVPRDLLVPGNDPWGLLVLGL